MAKATSRRANFVSSRFFRVLGRVGDIDEYRRLPPRSWLLPVTFVLVSLEHTQAYILHLNQIRAHYRYKRFSIRNSDEKDVSTEMNGYMCLRSSRKSMQFMEPTPKILRGA